MSGCAGPSSARPLEQSRTRVLPRLIEGEQGPPSAAELRGAWLGLAEAGGARDAEEEAPLGWQAPLLDGLCLAARYLKVLVACLLLGVLAGGAKILISPKTYRASAVAVLMPREKPILNASITAGSLEASDDRAHREATGALMLPSQPELYLAILRSRPVLRELIDRFRPRMRFPADKQRSDEEVSTLRRWIQLETSEEGLLSITVTTHDAALAADLANALLDEGRRASAEIERQMLLQHAGQLEEALAEREAELSAAEEQLEAFCERHRVVDLGTQATQHLVLLKEATGKRDKLRAERQALLNTFTERHSSVQDNALRLEEAEAAIRRIRAEVTGSTGQEGFGRVRVEHERLRSRRRMVQDMVATLSLKAQVFRLRAEQPAGCLAVIREAVAVHRNAGPGKKKTLAVSLGLALVLGIGLSFVLDQWRRAQLDPYLAERIAELRGLLRGVDALSARG